MKIDSCIIVRNENKNIVNLIEQLLAFSDSIYIVDTGSEDGTLETLYCEEQKYQNLHVSSFTWKHDYSIARNYAFEKSTDADYIFVCDGNDTLNDTLMNELLLFTWKKYDDSLPDIILVEKIYKERNVDVPILVKRIKHLKWTKQFNEYLETDESITQQKYFLNNAKIINNGSNNHYNKLETIKYYECMNQFFSVHDLMNKAIELQDNGYHISAFLMFKDIFYNRNYELNERFDAFLFSFGSYYYAKDQYDMYKGIEEMVKYFLKQGWENKKAFHHIADYYYAFNRYEEAEEMYERAYNRDASQDIELVYHQSPTDIFYILSQLIIINENNLGNHKKAKMYNDIVLALNPGDPGATQNQEKIFKYIE